MQGSPQTARKVIESQRSTIESLIQRVGQQKSFVDHPDLLAEWARYLCVRISGAIEVCVREILVEYADIRGGPQLRNFVQSRLSRSGGPENPRATGAMRPVRPGVEGISGEDA